jgi:hypothetical protein
MIKLLLSLFLVFYFAPNRVFRTLKLSYSGKR